MALARFKDLCIDANDAVTLGGFWSQVLGLELQRHEDGMVVLRGPTSQHSIWLDTVPEPRTVKQRVHLDVNAASTDEVVAAGAAVLDAESFPWTVLADPEGGELCAFVREPPVTQRLYEIVVDTADSAEASAGIAHWWAQVLGAAVVHDDRGFSYVHQIPGAPFESFDFIPVPEAKTVKNRIHWDVDTDDVSALVEAGATILRPRDEEISWTVLADPDGNEFCAFTD
jgi:catechol 2,3-dioxygenase-like lactoylglutathione lyase family enzyme